MIVELASSRTEHSEEGVSVPQTVKPWIVTDLTSYAGSFATEKQALDYLTRRNVFGGRVGCHVYREDELPAIINTFNKEHPSMVYCPSVREDGSFDYDNPQIRPINHAQSDHE